MNTRPHRLETRFLNQELSSPIFNASGPLCVSEDDLEALETSRASMILTKSCTLHPRLGNAIPRYQAVTGGSINSMGLPNLGIKAYLDYSENRDCLNEKPFLLSVAGLSLDENRELLQLAKKSASLSGIELNLSCPNIPGKPQIAYDFESLQDHLEILLSDWPVDAPAIGVKLPPYFDPSHWDTAASILNSCPTIRFVTAINSVGNTLAFASDSVEVAIAPKNGLGGLGGGMIKPIALANVRELRNRLRPDIAVIGCGGVESGRDVLEHLLCGAQAVQVGTAFYSEGTAIFSRLESELLHELMKSSFSSVDDARGKWKPRMGIKATHATQYENEYTNHSLL